MSKPVMGDSTPRTKEALDEAWTLPTTDHQLGYMISFAQGLEMELKALRPEAGELLNDLVICCDQYDGAKQASVDNYRDALTKAREYLKQAEPQKDGS